MFKKIILSIIIMATTICSTISASPIKSTLNKYHFDDITILVPSCDKYSPLWEPFFTLLFKNWPSLLTHNNNVPIVLIGNNKTYKSQRITNVSIPNEISWSDNVLEAIKHIKTKYTIIILEDYLFNAPVQEDNLHKYYNFMRKHNAAFMQLANVSGNQSMVTISGTHPDGLQQFSKHSKYRTALQIGLWNTASLKWLLRTRESAWRFEIPGSIRSEGMPQPFLAATQHNIFSHLNAAHYGVINNRSLAFIKTHGMEFQPGALLLEDSFKAKYKLWKANSKCFIYKYIYEPTIKFARKIL
ncbi:MAG: hypothetical protein COC15_02860 [Legionellales bacterium]|nr:MAG: hypothetical protein COC15_02860 [Legionellales bacterium]